MNFNKIMFTLIALIGLQTIEAQKNNENSLKEVIVKGFKTVNGIGHLPDSKDGIIYAGKKSEIILVDSLDANKAVNNTRQILGRIP
ncbi:MAG TPA: hypothetical protein VFS71_12650, partial [Flavobacterium sp.]|uniref:hypothetical protein n=1 Tax=Flavobacterium sp. TaxID=239 RepID=UPI002DB9FBB9